MATKTTYVRGCVHVFVRTRRLGRTVGTGNQLLPWGRPNLPPTGAPVDHGVATAGEGEIEQADVSEEAPGRVCCGRFAVDCARFEVEGRLKAKKPGGPSNLRLVETL